MLIRPNLLCSDCGCGTAIESFSSVADCSIFGPLQPSPSHCCFYDGPRTPVDAIIITAVSVEFDAIRANLHPDGEGAWKQHTTASDGEWYVCAFEGERNSKIRVALTQQSTMGLSSAAALTAQSIQIFRPAYVIMAGITAGRADKTKIGDVIAPNFVFDYGAGKWVEENEKLVFLPRPEQHQADDDVTRRCRDIGRDIKFLGEIHNAWRNDLRDGTLFKQPSVHVEPLVSGAAVVNAQEIWKRIIDYNDTVVGLDMEAYGVAQATKSAKSGNYTPQWIIAKSVCDFGINKQDGAQRYAAFTSAMFVRKYIKEYFLNVGVEKCPVHFNINKNE